VVRSGRGEEEERREKEEGRRGGGEDLPCSGFLLIRIL
jgi:hypothetical protein